MLHVAEALGTGHGMITRSLYERFSDERKLEVWGSTGLLDARNLLGTVSRFGNGGWVSKLVAPETYGVGQRGTEVAFKDDELLMDMETDVTGLGVPRGCDIVVEVDVFLYAGHNARPLVMGQGLRPVIIAQHARSVHIETIRVEVSAKEKEIKNVRFTKVAYG